MYIPEYGPFKAIDDISTLKQYVATVPVNKDIFVLLCGTRDEYGRSWCPTCERLVGHLKKVARQVLERAEIIYVQVGQPAEFRAKSNPFKLDKIIKLNKVPTLINWRSKERINSTEAEDYPKVDKFLGIR